MKSLNFPKRNIFIEIIRQGKKWNVQIYSAWRQFNKVYLRFIEVAQGKITKYNYNRGTKNSSMRFQMHSNIHWNQLILRSTKIILAISNFWLV